MATDLVQQLAQQTELPEEKAKALAGKFLGSVERLVSTNEDASKTLKEAVPELEEWKALSNKLIVAGDKGETTPAAKPTKPTSPLQQVAAGMVSDAKAKAEAEMGETITSKEQVRRHVPLATAVLDNPTHTHTNS